MDTRKALDIACHSAELVALCARYQAKYGRHSVLKPGSSRAEWDLFRDILNKQAAIAELLDTSVLQAPGEVVNQWWKRQDVIDLSIVSDLCKEAARLIGCAAYHDEDPNGGQWSYAEQAAQAAIAVMLHPTARQNALNAQAEKIAS
ncbi:MAG: hypothetical protein IPM16_03295 [Chloroflexi bacterium]|nr:hypothetical protein [Chloroflexota bacterium]